MHIKQLVVISMLCAPAALHAQGAPKPVDHDAVYAQCLREAGGARNATVGACSQTVAQTAAGEIAQLYGRTHAALAQRERKDAMNFESAHKAWQIYRDNHCNLASTYIGSPMYNFCPMQMNIARVKELREFAESAAR